jgi:hypothetical protein
LDVNRLSAASLMRSVRTSSGVAFREFVRRSSDKRVPDKAKVFPMFMLPAYDSTAIAMLGFGILTVLGLPFIF